MDIGRMGSLQPGTHLKGFRNASSGNNSPAASGDSFTPADNSSVRHNDLKKAAELLLKKTANKALGEWTVESNGTPSVVTDKCVIIGGFDVKTRAVDPKTGQDKWTANLKGYVDEGKDGSIYVSTHNKKLVELDSDTGKEKWSMDFDRDIRYLKTGDDGTIYANTAVDLLAIDPQKKEVKWKCRVMGYPCMGPGGEIYVTDGDRTVSSVDPKTEKVKWSFDTLARNRSAPAIGKNGDLYAADYLGIMTAIDPSDGKPKWKFDTDSTILDSPLIGPDGDIYVNNCNQHMYAVDPDTGKLKWQFDGEGFNNSYASFAPDGTILFGGGDRVYGLNPKTGKKLWEKQMPGAVTHAPIQGKDGRVYFQCWDKKIYCIRVTDVKETLKKDMEEETDSSGSADKNLEIKQGNQFIDIGGVRLKVNQQE